MSKGNGKETARTLVPPFFVVTLGGDPAITDNEAAVEQMERQWREKWKEFGFEVPGPLFVLPPGSEFEAVIDD